MKVKKTKLPENLYHYTSLIKYRKLASKPLTNMKTIILSSG